jgi:hypothetical protein
MDAREEEQLRRRRRREMTSPEEEEEEEELKKLQRAACIGNLIGSIYNEWVNTPALSKLGQGGEGTVAYGVPPPDDFILKAVNATFAESKERPVTKEELRMYLKAIQRYNDRVGSKEERKTKRELRKTKRELR